MNEALKVVYKDEDLLTVKQLAEHFGVSDDTIRRKIADLGIAPDITGENVGNGTGKVGAKYTLSKLKLEFCQKELASISPEAKVYAVRTTLEELCADVQDNPDAAQQVVGIAVMMIQALQAANVTLEAQRKKLLAENTQITIERDVALMQRDDLEGFSTLGRLNEMYNFNLTEGQLSKLSKELGLLELPRYVRDCRHRNNWGLYAYKINQVLPYMEAEAACSRLK
jgi:hypothetical protein